MAKPLFQPALRREKLKTLTLGMIVLFVCVFCQQCKTDTRVRPGLVFDGKNKLLRTKIFFLSFLWQKAVTKGKFVVQIAKRYNPFACLRIAQAILYLLRRVHPPPLDLMILYMATGWKPFVSATSPKCWDNKITRLFKRFCYDSDSSHRLLRSIDQSHCQSNDRPCHLP